jgi:NitT/TauT family transport system substrate-binding protein
MKVIRAICTCLFMLVFLLAACKSAAETPLEKVNVQFNDLHGFDFSGFYTAQQNGFYKDAGLSVELVTSPPELADPVGTVSQKRAQFAVSPAEEVIRGVASGLDVLAVASIYRESPLVVMSLKSSKIYRPQDLIGKTVGVYSYGSRGATSRDVLFLALLRNQNIKVSDLNFNTTKDAIGSDELTSGAVDARSAVSLTQEAVEAGLTAAEDSTKECDYIYFGEYGVRTYVNVIITSASLAKEQPDLVRRFIQATMQGYQYTIEHPEEAAQFALQVDPSLNLQEGIAAIQASIPLIDTGADILGWMEEAVWENSQDTLLKAVMLPAPVPLSQVYSNDYLMPIAP